MHTQLPGCSDTKDENVLFVVLKSFKKVSSFHSFTPQLTAYTCRENPNRGGSLLSPTALRGKDADISFGKVRC